jgi:cytochrome P450
MLRTDPFFDDEVVECPYGYYARLRTGDPVHHIGGTDVFLVSRVDVVKEVVGEPARFSSRTGAFLHLDERGHVDVRPPVGPPGADDEVPAVLATADPPVHGRHRSLLSSILSTSSVRAREPELRGLVDAALDPALAGGRVEWMGEVAKPVPMLMVARLLGVADRDAATLERQGYAALELIGGFVADADAPELQARLLELGPAIAAFSAQRASGDPDLTTAAGVCAQAVADGQLDELEALGILAILLSAGGESTTSLLGSAVRILAERRDLQERLRGDPSLIPTFVEEVCRIEPPFRGHYRRVVADTTLAGVALPKGARLVLAWPAANRDDSLGGDEVDLERPRPRQHLGFGWGIHLCIGAPLARLEARVTLEQLLERTRAFTVAPGAQLRHHRSLMVRRLVDLPLDLRAAP